MGQSAPALSARTSDTSASASSSARPKECKFRATENQMTGCARRRCKCCGWPGCDAAPGVSKAGVTCNQAVTLFSFAVARCELCSWNEDHCPSFLAATALTSECKWPTIEGK